MFTFDKNFVLNSTNSWFANKLDNGFSLVVNDTKSIVIFGYNGIGKSTIFKCIKNSNNPEISFLDYEFKDDKRFVGKKLEISVNINQILSNSFQIDSINKQYDASSILKEKYGITKKSDATKISSELATVRQNKIITFSNHHTEIDGYINSHPNVDAKVLYDVWDELSKFVDSETELDNDLKNKKYITIKKAYELLNDDTCPVCDVKTPNLKDILENKLSQLENHKSLLIEKMSKLIPVDGDTINNYYNAYNDIKSDPNVLVDYFLCGGDINIYDSMETLLNQRDSLMNQNSTLIQNALNIYNSVKSQENRLKKDFKRYFDINDTDIVFDDINYKVTISFTRDISTYSTGEINLMSFLFHIYSFVGSDKKTLILDDPASSLDLINHYKIAYEIVRNTGEKNMVVLTHSVDFVNIINSQRIGAFDFYYLEECNNLIHINRINANRRDSNVISLNQLADTDDFVRVLAERENALYQGQNDNVEVFHYTLNEKFIDNDTTKLSNHKLAELIDNFSVFNMSDFYSNTLTKIKYLCALRVWIEKKLYEIIPVSDPKKNTFLGEHELSKKIEIILPRDNSNPYNLGFTREDLMSKKVMLNQGIHYHSKVMPMAYAINISLDQLAKEINEIKQLF